MNKNTQLVKVNVSTPAKVYDLEGYTWNKKSNQDEAYGQYVGLLESVIHGDREKAVFHKKEIDDIFHLDACQHACSLARSQGIPAKVFAVKEEQKPEFKVKGLEFDWLVKDMQTSRHQVPQRFKKMARDIKEAGIEFEQFYIAEPEVKPLPVPRRKPRDPVLLGSIGRWLVEIGRWE